jgi:hypothetical protein
MSWKVVIVGPAGTVYTDTNAFKLLYPFPTREEAETHAACFRTVGMNVEMRNVTATTRKRRDGSS